MDQTLREIIIGLLIGLGCVIIVAAAAFMDFRAHAQQPPATPCDAQLEIVQGGRAQAERQVAALWVEVQALKKQLAEAKPAAAPQLPAKPADKK